MRTRVSKITYGNFCSIPYDPNDPDHILRYHSVYTTVSGEERLSGFFDIILPKVSCLFSFLKSMLFKKNFLFVEYPSFGDEGIQNGLFSGFGFCS